jgi:hypothetical protein
LPFFYSKPVHAVHILYITKFFKICHVIKSDHKTAFTGKYLGSNSWYTFRSLSKKTQNITLSNVDSFLSRNVLVVDNATVAASLLG